MDATNWTSTASECLGKEGFSTPQIASRVLRRQMGKRRDYKRNHVYRCNSCGLFHIGAKPKSVHAPRQRVHNYGDGEDMV